MKQKCEINYCSLIARPEISFTMSNLLRKAGNLIGYVTKITFNETFFWVQF